MQSTAFARRLRKDSTDVEQILWKQLRSRQMENCKFRRQVPIGSYIVDFVCFENRLIIELDGGQHNQMKHDDKKRDENFKKAEFQIIRFWNNEVLCNLNGVLETIRRVLMSTPSPRPSPTRGEGAKRKVIRMPSPQPSPTRGEGAKRKNYE